MISLPHRNTRQDVFLANDQFITQKYQTWCVAS